MAGKHMLALAVFFAGCSSTQAAHAAAFSQTHLRAGSHVVKQLPPIGVAAVGAPAAVAAGSPLAAPVSPAGKQIADLFAKMDANGDGKVDVNEFVVAEQGGILPMAGAPAPAPAVMVAAAPMVAVAPAPAPAEAEEDVLPAHLQKPPPLPASIPEPPPPPRAPPPEPKPPPMPPREGDLVQAPPSDSQMESLGNVSQMMATQPGLDLDGSDPLQAPNTPPPIPAPLPPPGMPRMADPMQPPHALPEALMTPAPVAFGINMAHTFPSAMKVVPLEVVAMPVLGGPYAVLLQTTHFISSRLGWWK